jgi:hypothetical protein
VIVVFHCPGALNFVFFLSWQKILWALLNMLYMHILISVNILAFVNPNIF